MNLNGSLSHDGAVAPGGKRAEITTADCGASYRAGGRVTPLDVSVQFARDGQTDTSLQLGSLPHRNTSAGEELPRLQHTTEFSLREQEVSAGTREAGGDAARVRVKKTKNKAKQKNK